MDAHITDVTAFVKDASMVKPGFRAVPPQCNFEFAALFLLLLGQKRAANSKYCWGGTYLNMGFAVLASLAKLLLLVNIFYSSSIGFVNLGANINEILKFLYENFKKKNLSQKTISLPLVE